MNSMSSVTRDIQHQDKALTRDMAVRQGFLPIYVHDDLDSRMLVEGAVDAGCEVLEYTCRRHDARQMIPWIKKQFPHVKVFGATLMDGPRTEQALRRKTPNFMSVKEMVDLGADGLVSFLCFRPSTYQSYGDQLVLVPGVATANEALDQLELGADLIKAVIATTGGEELVCKSRIATHGGLPFLVTGGVTSERMASMIAAGVVMGSAGFDLILKADLDTGRTITRKLVSERVRVMLETVRETRRTYQPDLFEAVEAGQPNLMDAGPWVSH